LHYITLASVPTTYSYFITHEVGRYHEIFITKTNYYRKKREYKMKVCLILLILVFSIAVSRGVEIDYYWKDYNGIIPSDAFQAGVDGNGKPIYVGQGFFLNTGLLPGTLHPGSTNIKITAVKRVFSTNKNVKILCTSNSHRLQWRNVNYNDIPLLTNARLVVGGQETNTDVHIGRALHEGSTEIGKIYNLAPFQGLALPNSQQSETLYKNFEILTFSLDQELSKNEIRR